MRILIATDDVISGGTAQVAKHLAELLGKVFDVSFSVLDLPQTKNYVDAIEALGIRNHPLNARHDDWFTSVHDTNSACRVLLETRPDLIVSCGATIMNSHLALKRVASAIGLPFISIVNGYFDGYPLQLQGPLREFALEGMTNAAHTVFVAQASRSSFERDFFGLGERASVITNACRGEFFQPKRTDERKALRSQLGIADEELLLICPGRIEPAKGQHLIIEAMHKLEDERARKRLRFLLVGHSIDGHAENLRARVSAMGLADRFIFGQHTDRLTKAMDAADLCILTSYHEGMPLVVCEAMAKGLPMIATAVGDVARFVSPDTGFILPAPDGREHEVIGSLSKIFETLPDPCNGLSEMRGVCKLIALRHFHPASMLAGYKDVILDAMIEHGGRQTDWSAIDSLLYRVEAGQQVSLSEATSCNVLERGWSAPTSGGRWIGEDPARVRILRGREAPGTFLNLSFTPFLNGSLTRNRLTVSISGKRDQSVEVSEKARHVVKVDLEGQNPQEPLEVRLSAHRTVSIAREGQRASKRRIRKVAFLVHDLAIT